MIHKYKKIIMIALACGHYLNRHELSYYCNCWMLHPDLTRALFELEVEGRIDTRFHNDPANRDSCTEYCIL